MSWRVDIAARSRHIADLNEPCSLVELTLADKSSNTVAHTIKKFLFKICRFQSVLRFEIDRKGIENLAAQVAIIQKSISDAAGR